MNRKLKKIIALRNSYPTPKFLKCYLESDTKYKHIKGKDAYAAILSQNNDKRVHHRFFIKGLPRSWDPKHKTYWMIFDFEAQIGDIIEFRRSSKNYAEKIYYIAYPNEKTRNLMEISRFDAYRVVNDRQTYLKTQNNHLRTIPASVKCQVWERDDHRCVYCGSTVNLEFDHIIPFSWGGSNSPENVQLLCRTCNRRKSDTLTDGNTKSLIRTHVKNQQNKKIAS
ncbi:HNH endonuclease [Promethearchaeum syntrophicum]|uniref:HNH endonuclease n=1 Tax=Promethearchaeum syntrophicum TaxID=2594042 RepID=A0A5B9DB16_9ARCH|nr:HNH endonuclease [Candidatus Prometheoarchaeum syntrophicum]